MTTLPDWLVERIALDEVPVASKGRLRDADEAETAKRVAALRADNVAELSAYPAGPAVAQIEARVAREKQLAGRRRARFIGVLGVAMAAATALVLFVGTRHHPVGVTSPDAEEITRAKGATRVSAFRHVGDTIEKLDEDALVKSGDLLQLRYSAGSARFGIIASIDGAGFVTLHYPTAENAPAEATALSSKPTALPNGYQLDDAPDFERFFFITADQPIDVGGSLASLRAFAQRSDRATAALELPNGMNQTSLRLRKPSPQNKP
jgi:hypothetical protein